MSPQTHWELEKHKRVRELKNGNTHQLDDSQKALQLPADSTCLIDVFPV